VLFDMVFLKLIMPSVSGYECAKELRQIEESHKIGSLQRHFICGLTSLVDERVEMESREAGIDHVVVKPLSYEKIKQLIDKHMRKRHK
jgi:PleD family two-component response regulator